MLPYYLKTKDMERNNELYKQLKGTYLERNEYIYSEISLDSYVRFLANFLEYMKEEIAESVTHECIKDKSMIIILEFFRVKWEVEPSKMSEIHRILCAHFPFEQRK